VFYKLLGIRVQWHGVQHLPAGRHVVVSNHVTVWRSCALHLYDLASCSCSSSTCCPPACSLRRPHWLFCWQVGDLMVLYSRPRSYVHLITSRLPKRLTQVHQSSVNVVACTGSQHRKVSSQFHLMSAFAAEDTEDQHFEDHVQARHHRVKLRHASGETYCRLADEGMDADPIHLFPGGPAALHWLEFQMYHQDSSPLCMWQWLAVDYCRAEPLHRRPSYCKSSVQFAAMQRAA
jgi:hypothetical protein